MTTDLAIEPQPVLSRRASSRRFLLWAVALLPFLVVAFSRLPDGPGLEADDYGQYLMHARALAEGRPYTDIGYIYSRFRYGLGPMSAPPGLPVTLAAVYKVFGPNMVVLKLVMLCFATAFVLLAALYFARHADRRLGIGVALLVGLSPAIAHDASQLLTDLPFAALVWAVIYLMDMPGRLSALRLVGVTALGAYAVAFRVPGAVLFPALILFAALRYRDQGLRPLLPPLAWVLGLVLVAAIMPIEKFAVIRFGRILELDSAQMIENAKAYWVVIFDSHLHPFPWPRANDVFHIVTGGVMAVGLASWARKSFNKFGTIFAFTYAVMLIVVPIHDGRYLWPLFPFFVFGLLNGVRVIVPRIAPAFTPRASAAALAFALVLVPPAMIKAIREPRAGDLMNVPEVQDVVRKLREEAAAGPVRVVFYKPRSFAWRTGFPAMGAISGPAPCLISEFARGGITHVVGRQGASERIHRDIRMLVSNRPDLFTEQLRTGNLVLYRFAVSPAEAAEARATCKQIRTPWSRH